MKDGFHEASIIEISNSNDQMSHKKSFNRSKTIVGWPKMFVLNQKVLYMDQKGRFCSSPNSFWFSPKSFWFWSFIALDHLKMKTKIPHTTVK